MLQNGGIVAAASLGSLDWESWKRRAIRAAPILFIFLVAFIFRSQHFGNPDVDLDEQFYLLVADRMLHGSLVYVDIWDRKPIGLFLIFAAARLLGGDGVIQYQIVATLFVCATCYFMWRIAQRYVNQWQAIFPALLYIFWLELYFGGAGQVGVFYNLCTIVAIWLALRAKDQDDIKLTSRIGFLAMVMFGIGIQIKYTIIPEGMYVGSYLIFCLYQQGTSYVRLAAIAFLFCLGALLPTMIVCVYYLLNGHFSEFYFANFVSIFLRGALVGSFVSRSLEAIFITAVPLIASAIVGLFLSRLRIFGSGRSDFRFLVGWLTAAAVGFSMIGNFYIHYFVSLLLPLCMLTAPLFCSTFVICTLFTTLALYPINLAGVPKFEQTREKILAIQQMTDIIRYHLKGRCLFVFDGPAILYMTNNACIPTRFAYPDHLSNDVEKTGIGTDTQAEMRNILASKPGVIVYAQRPVIPKMNANSVAQIRYALKRDYIKVATVQSPLRAFDLYELRVGIINNH